MGDSLSSDLASLRLDHEDEPPRRGPLRALLGLGLGAAVLFGAYALGAPLVEASLFRAEVALTEIALLSPAQAAVDLTSTGYVVPLSSSKVGAKIPGRLARVLVKEGDRVKAGQVLATLEDEAERSAIATARARASAARARAVAARATLAEAQLRADRERSLAQRGAAAMASAQDQEARARASAESAKSAAADVPAAEAEVRALEVTLRQTSILSPMDGTVVSKPLRPGELMGPDLTPLLELADLSTLVVETDVPEGRLGRVKLGAPCEIVLDAFPGKRFRGAALDIVPKVNRAKATVPVKVRFVDAPEGVLPEMAARVSFLQRALDEKAIKEPPRLVVPAAAVVDRQGGKVVFIADGERLRMAPVTLGPALAGGFELKAGPPAGTRVVKDPPPALQDGRKFKEKSE